MTVNEESLSLRLDECTSMALDHALKQTKTSVVLLPLGSVEPHGPHLPLATDRLLSEINALRAAKSLRDHQVAAWVAPALAYGVTEYAQGFCGAISLSQSLYENLLIEISEQYLKAGFQLICWINHHLEPKQLAALKEAQQRFNESQGQTRVIAPAVISRRWGRSLGHEFKSGACHAGEYESSMILNSHPQLVHQDVAQDLPSLDISLSTAIRQGRAGFIDIGMDQAYTGSPATASATEGERLYQAHTNMVFTEIIETLGLDIE